MTFERRCDQQKQRCPTPYLCQSGCYFNETTNTKAEHDKAVHQFWDSLPVTMVEPRPWYARWLDAPGNFWDRCGFVVQGIIVLALILGLGFVAVALIGGLI